MTTDTGAGGNPADIPPASPVDSANAPYDIGAQFAMLAEQNGVLISMVAAMSAQVNWLCQIVNALSQSMPPFMRGAINVPTPGAFPNPGHPTPYGGHH